jgi:hypothetical protein
VATTADSKDDDSSSPLPWILLALAVLVAMLALAWYLSNRSRQKELAAQWEDRRDALLEDAQRAHNGSIDLISRWGTYAPDQLRLAWSTEMAGLERLRSRLSGTLAAAPDHEDTVPMQNVAVAVDDLQIALGDVDPASSVHPPPRAIGAAEALDRAIYEAQHGVYAPETHDPYPPGYQ